MKLTFEYDDVKELIAREAAEILQTNSSRIDVNLGYGYASVECTIKADDDDNQVVIEFADKDI